MVSCKQTTHSELDAVCHHGPMAAQPDGVVDALRSQLGSDFTVALEWLEQRPYAVVRRTNSEETWVDLGVSIEAFPSSSPNEIAAAIADAEQWG
jgi:hypothetical protein